MTLEIPWTALMGGALIGLSASLLLAVNGQIAGISGLVAGTIKPDPNDGMWRPWFFVGLLMGGVMLRVFYPSAFGTSNMAPAFLIGSGLLVGFGTRLGSGCTSGHGGADPVRWTGSLCCFS